ncbi:MAG: PilN domain-containing protein [Candidatus Marinimicrobia bacterium]|nr:PilN domain-containing protein [Candidatus Neomarinimicrobiota bacterium]
MNKYIVINLNQAESRESKIERWKEHGKWVVFGIYMVLLTFACALILYINFSYKSMIADKKQQIIEVESEMERLRHVGKNLSKDNILGLAELEDNRILWARNLELLGAMTPDDMSLTGLRYAKNKLTIVGIAVIYEGEKEFDIVNSFVRTLKNNVEFANEFTRIRFSSFARQDFRGQDIVQFQVEATLKRATQSEKESRYRS